MLHVKKIKGRQRGEGSYKGRNIKEGTRVRGRKRKQLNEERIISPSTLKWALEFLPAVSLQNWVTNAAPPRRWLCAVVKAIISPRWANEPQVGWVAPPSRQAWLLLCASQWTRAKKSSFFSTCGQVRNFLPYETAEVSHWCFCFSGECVSPPGLSWGPAAHAHLCLQHHTFIQWEEEQVEIFCCLCGRFLVEMVLLV